MLEEGWGGRIDFTDYLLLLKIDGEWKCVAKAYNQNSDASYSWIGLRMEIVFFGVLRLQS